MAKTERITIGRSGGMSLSRLVWRRFRAPVGRALVVEKTLDLNPHLAALGPVLPQGTVVDLYIPEAAELRQAASTQLRLFGLVE